MKRETLLQELRKRAPLLRWELGSEVGPPQTMIQARTWINGERLSVIMSIDDIMLEHVDDESFLQWALSRTANNIAQSILEWMPEKQAYRNPRVRALEYARDKWGISDETRIVKVDWMDYHLPVAKGPGIGESETIHLDTIYGFEPIVAMGYGPRTDTLAIQERAGAT